MKIEPLGMNARNFLYILPYNKAKAKARADDKLQTKKILLKKGIATPELLASFTDVKDARKFKWSSLPKSFVVKPAHGYGGGGIILVKKWNGESGVLQGGGVIDIQQLEAHIFDILMGVYSLNSISDVAFIEERIVPMKFFKKIPVTGIPDLRVVVFSGVPVMAMMRIPTSDSDGKANLTMGAVGVGIDISTGITTYGWQRGYTVRLFPGTKIKMRGIKVPMWDEILDQAVHAQRASKLGFAGIDIILDKNKGPLVIEINARPGLSIQSVNQASLLERLKRVENIKPKPTLERGIEIGKSLFTEEFSTKVKKVSNVIGVFEKVGINNGGSKKDHMVIAKIDTGAYRTSIDISLAKKLDLVEHDRVVKVRAASGKQERNTVKIILTIKGKKIETTASLTDRKELRHQLIIGRKNIRGFLVDTSKIDRSELFEKK